MRFRCTNDATKTLDFIITILIIIIMIFEWLEIELFENQFHSIFISHRNQIDREWMDGERKINKRIARCYRFQMYVM